MNPANHSTPKTQQSLLCFVAGEENAYYDELYSTLKIRKPLVKTWIQNCLENKMQKKKPLFTTIDVGMYSCTFHGVLEL